MFSKSHFLTTTPRTGSVKMQTHMAFSQSLTPEQELQLLDAARGGDESAYESLVEPHRNELHAHCYRMLGSIHDAEDSLQDTLLRAWRGLPKFDGRSSLRSWLYRIATNASLDTIAKRKKRVLPYDFTGAADPSAELSEPVIESTWVEPYPDDVIGIASGMASPESRYELLESVELAFVAALQNLPPNQRATLILRDVLGYSAKETAETLDVSVASVTSALQRARESVDERLPDESQQATLRTLGDTRVREMVEAYMEAMQRGDVEAIVSMLTEDATWSMPPLPSWFGPKPEVEGFLRKGPMSGEWKWKHVPAHANGQAAVGCYTWLDEAGAYLPFCIDVLTFEKDRIRDVTAFITRTTELPEGDSFDDWPAFENSPEKVAAIFERFNLPVRLND